MPARSTTAADNVDRVAHQNRNMSETWWYALPRKTPAGDTPNFGMSSSPWATFLKAHRGAIAAMDFFKVEVMTLTGPVCYSVLVVMDLKTRRVEVAGIVREAYEKWMIQIVRHLTDAVDGFLIGKTYVIMDRDPVFTARVRDMLRHAGTKPVRLPRRSPNLNAFVERFVRSIKEECLDRVIPLGEAHLRELIRQYVIHYHAERPH
jgi:putative transposase